MTTDAQQRWAATYHYAASRSPYYRELFRRPTSLPPLDQVPLVDKTILSERQADFLCVPREQIVEIVTTSGTTGQPLLWMLTEGDVERLAVNERLSFGCAGLTARDTVLIAVAMDRCFMAGMAYWLGLRALGCAVVRAGPASPRLILEMIERVQATVIVAVPSLLRRLADTARETGFDLRNSSVTKAICIGEPIRDRGLRLNTPGQAIEESWGVKAYANYGVTELANSLGECEAGRGGHLHDEQLYIEILDETGQPVVEGEPGEVVATTLGVTGMPLIRYRTGDCAALHQEPCPCGRKTPRLGPILGRRHQKLKFRGTSLFPSMLTAVLDEAREVESYVILARRESELSDSIEVLIHGAASLPSLGEAFQARTKITPQIRLVSREDIEKWQMPPEARKRRTFVDLR